MIKIICSSFLRNRRFLASGREKNLSLCDISTILSSIESCAMLKARNHVITIDLDRQLEFLGARRDSHAIRASYIIPDI